MSLSTCGCLSPPLTCDQRVLFEVAWQHQPKEDREAQNKEVPGGVQINKLQVGQSHCCDHTEQGAEESSQDRVRQRGKQGAEFTHKPQQQHHGSSILDHTSAAHLEDRSEISMSLGCQSEHVKKLWQCWLVSLHHTLLEAQVLDNGGIWVLSLHFHCEFKMTKNAVK